MPSPLHSAALAYARHGWFVFPLSAGSKVPESGSHGVLSATRDLARINAWWKKNPRLNIGIALHPSGLGVVDIDVKPDKLIDGRPTIEELVLLYGPIGSCALQHTPSRGRHYVFRVRAGQGIIDKTHWHHGIDLLTAKHRYIVAAPSVVNDRPYRWESLQALSPWDEAGYMSQPWSKLANAPAVSDSGREHHTGEADLLDTVALRLPGVDIKELQSILAVLNPNMGRDEWLRVIWGAAAQWSGTKEEQSVIDEIEIWSSMTDKAGQYKAGEVAERFAEHRSEDSRGSGHVTWRGIRAMARNAGWSPFSMGNVDPAKWESYLLSKKNEDGTVSIKPMPWNVALFLSFHKNFKGAVKRNVLTDAIEMHKNSICPLRDPTRLPTIYNRDSDWIGTGQALNGLIKGDLRREDIVPAVVVAADVHAYDPIKQWIDGLIWDGTRRIDTWIPRVCGTDDNKLNRAISRAWLVGLAARASAEYDGRGVKMDSVLVLQGFEGIGKSTVGSVLGGDWYTSFSNSLDNENIYYTIERSVVLEFPEMDSMSRTEASRVKALVTTQADVFRRKYAPSAASKPRRCVFIGTVNEDTFLTKDMTMRRWWVVRCGRQLFDLKWLAANRDQLIAEAKVAWDAGELPILPKDVRTMHQKSVEGVRMEHPYEEALRKWAQDRPVGEKVTLGQVAELALMRTAVSMTVHDMRKLGECMRIIGWEKKHTEGGNLWQRAGVEL